MKECQCAVGLSDIFYWVWVGVGRTCEPVESGVGGTGPDDAGGVGEGLRRTVDGTVEAATNLARVEDLRGS